MKYRYIINIIKKSIASILTILKDSDVKIKKVMRNGLKFSFVLTLFATYILFIYILISNPSFYHIGLSLFQSSLMFGIAFFICGIAFSIIERETR